jgi:two-component system chemotaxis response regulator CheY
VRSCLVSLGHSDIDEACDGADALSKAKASNPGLILLDWNMPNMNGLEFLRAFRASDKTTPVIMVTTEAEKPRVIEAIESGANDYVVKPFTPDVLEQHVKRTLARARAA